MTRSLFLSLVALLGAAANLAAQAAPGKGGGQSPVSREEIEDLKRMIEGESRPSLELLFDGHTESGDLNNRLDFLKYGGRLNLRAGSASLHLTFQRINYRTLDDYLEGAGTRFAVGLSTKPSERAQWRIELGAAHLSSDSWSITGLASVTVKPSEAAHYSLSASRTPVEESLQSAVGLRPIVGPFAGQLVGVVLDNRLTASGTYRLAARVDVTGEAALGTRQGSNVPSNFFRRAGGGAGFDAVAREGWRSVSLLRLGFWVEYFAFNDNRLGYGGASLLDIFGQPVPLSGLGSDGVSPEPTPTSPGVGGYFSPSSFVSGVARVDLRGKVRPSLAYAISAFAGQQSFTASTKKLAAGISAAVTLRASDRLSIPVTYSWDNYGPFQQQALAARMVLLF